MKLNQTITTTPFLTQLLIDIEANKKALSLINIEPARIELARQQSFLKSGLYSARIEGNPLTLESLSYSSSKLQQLEVKNITNALKWLYKNKHTYDIPFIKNLHARVMHNLRADAGHFRAEQTAIFNSAGVAIYLTPPHSDITPTLEQMIQNYQKSQDHILLKISRFHYQFEHLHPFVDGNGRVGRLLTNAMLFEHSYSLNGSIILDQEIETHRDVYYYTLNTDSHDITSFVQFFLECTSRAQETALANLSVTELAPKLSLSPRRQEILAIIRDHSPISFDQIHRRFMAVTTSTLHYDLQQLQKVGLIRKLGTTRSAQYQSA